MSASLRQCFRRVKRGCEIFCTKTLPCSRAIQLSPIPIVVGIMIIEWFLLSPETFNCRESLLYELSLSGHIRQAIFDASELEKLTIECLCYCHDHSCFF